MYMYTFTHKMYNQTLFFVSKNGPAGPGPSFVEKEKINKNQKKYYGIGRIGRKERQRDMSPIILQPQLSPKHIIHFPQMPFCISHLHHSFLALYLQPSWAFSVSYIHGLHTEVQFKILQYPIFP